MNLTRLWAQLPDVVDGYGYLAGVAAREGGLTLRQRSALTSACAATPDSHWSWVCGPQLAGFTGAGAATSVHQGHDDLDSDEKVLTRWARLISTYPSNATEDDVDELRAAGFSDQHIVALTFFVALAAAFATVSDAPWPRAGPCRARRGDLRPADLAVGARLCLRHRTQARASGRLQYRPARAHAACFESERDAEKIEPPSSSGLRGWFVRTGRSSRS